MLAAFHVNHAEHQRLHGEAMRAGLARHGIRCEFHPWDKPVACDFAVLWGWRQQRVIAAGRPILVMERGHLQDRFVWTSCGWGGLGRHARYAEVDDAGARFRHQWGALLQPWRESWDPERPVLLCGQVPGDAALGDLDVDAWAQAMTDQLLVVGSRVRFRPHPFLVREGRPLGCPRGAVLSLTPDLAGDLAVSKLVVTYNSTVAVETVLAGVPTLTLDPGSMAWDVTPHEFRDVGHVRPPREAWAARLAWCQWSLEEIRAGTAWEHLKGLLPA